MIYRVTVNFSDFDFSDVAEAIAFAEAAKMHYISPGEKENKAVSVTIELIAEEKNPV